MKTKVRLTSSTYLGRTIYTAIINETMKYEYGVDSAFKGRIDRIKSELLALNFIKKRGELIQKQTIWREYIYIFPYKSEG